MVFPRTYAGTHINGMESFWGMLKRMHQCTLQKLFPKRLHCCVWEFAVRHNVREMDAVEQKRDTVAKLVGRKLLYRDMVADNGLSSFTR